MRYAGHGIDVDEIVMDNLGKPEDGFIAYYGSKGKVVCGVVDVVNNSTCSSVSDCAENEYCAGGECLADGQCNVDLDCKHPDNVYPVIACVGVLGCHGEDGRCGIQQCGDSFCPPGSVEATCVAAPCNSPPSCQESWEYCINDLCNGECGVILLDAAGNEVTCTPMQ